MLICVFSFLRRPDAIDDMAVNPIQYNPSMQRWLSYSGVSASGGKGAEAKTSMAGIGSPKPSVVGVAPKTSVSGAMSVDLSGVLNDKVKVVVYEVSGAFKIIFADFLDKSRGSGILTEFKRNLIDLSHLFISEKRNCRENRVCGNATRKAIDGWSTSSTTNITEFWCSTSSESTQRPIWIRHNADRWHN